MRSRSKRARGLLQKTLSSLIAGNIRSLCRRTVSRADPRASEAPNLGRFEQVTRCEPKAHVVVERETTRGSGLTRFIGCASASTKIPRLHLDLIDVTIRIGDVSRLRHLRYASRVKAWTPVVEFVATPMRQRECGVTIADAR
jgi:hypothetical protein